ncbi:hypothetical protein GH5_06928 [Leishmania sp. Ghana 2012 LV757]|uniref:hypothetical protein n=1 Tax=Leishmania sp. Ghana 2012 LV757 TaxID=2803181 RepID=UPI001B7C41C7|nr:hypothetical protein GH5_06928 [Leishmania sp. Ghana 2012 LV757]
MAGVRWAVPTPLAPPPHTHTSASSSTEFNRAIRPKPGVHLARQGDPAEQWPRGVYPYHEDSHCKSAARGTAVGMLKDVQGYCCNSGCTITRAAALPNTFRALVDPVAAHDLRWPPITSPSAPTAHASSPRVACTKRLPWGWPVPDTEK